ncbi:MAG: glycosyltransferase, partial [Planctomycetota bacterium]
MFVVQLVARLNDGGPARVIRQLAQALRSDGHRVLVVHGSPPEHEADLSPRLIADGISCTRLPHFGPAIDPLADLRASAALLRLLRAQAPDLLHSHTAKAGLLGRACAALLGMPCLHSYHGHVLRGYFSPRTSRLLL